MHEDLEIGAMHVAFVIPSLGNDGPSRVFVSLMRSAHAAGNRVTLLTSSVDPRLKDDPRDIIDLRLLGGASYPLRDYWKEIRDADPDVVLATQRAITTCSIISAVRGRSHPPLACRPANHPLENVRQQRPIRRLKISLSATAERLAWRGVDGIICQSPSMSDALWSRSCVFKSLIPNPVEAEMVDRLSVEPVELPKRGKPTFVAVGRLMHQKGIDILLRAMVVVLEAEPDARLWIVGDGPDRAKLARLATTLRVKHAVTFVGMTDNPFPYMAGADIFVQASRYEGLSNALIEAQVLGLPAVATDGPASGGVVIVDGKSGWLVGDATVPSLSRGLLRALNEHLDLDTPQISAAAREAFDARQIWTQYATFLVALTRRSAHSREGAPQVDVQR